MWLSVCVFMCMSWCEDFSHLLFVSGGSIGHWLIARHLLLPLALGTGRNLMPGKPEFCDP